MNPPPNIMSQDDKNLGVLSGAIAYVMWGLFPIYFVAVKQVPTLEIVSHRVLWSIPFGLIILLFRKQIRQTLSIFRNRKTILLLVLAAFAMGTNWGVYIWAIQQDQIFQGSLGYYINPLTYVLVGVVFFKEAISRLQIFAIALACIGVAILTFQGGVFPWISLVLVLTFTLYGVLRKQIDVGAVPGLFIETLALLLPALLLLTYLSSQDILAWGNSGWELNALLVLAGPLTVLPLSAFAFAARRISLSALGLLQYIGPTLQFALAIYYGEVFTQAHAWCFGFIWIGVGVFTYDAIRKSRQQNQAVSPTGNPQITPHPDSR